MQAFAKVQIINTACESKFRINTLCIMQAVIKVQNINIHCVQLTQWGLTAC